MPQIMIDTAAESAESLRLLSALLVSYATLKDASDSSDRNAGQSIAPVVQAAAAALAVTPHQHVITPDVLQNAGLVSEADMLAARARAAFGQGTSTVVPPGTLPSNVLPFPVGLPSLPATTLPVTTADASTQTALQLPVSSAKDAAPVVSAGPSVADATLPNVPGATPELDKAGIPWDERIHQSNRNKKKDGTWMLKRGLDEALAASVLAELAAKKLANNVPPVTTATGPVPGTGLPPAPTVTLPPPPIQPVSLPLPPAPAVGLPGSVGVAGLPTPPASPALPSLPAGLPAAPSLAALTPVQRFSAMMVKINQAKAVGVIDQNMVDEAHKALGLPQLQLAITKPELIPQIEAALGLV